MHKTQTASLVTTAFATVTPMTTAATATMERWWVIPVVFLDNGAKDFYSTKTQEIMDVGRMAVNTLSCQRSTPSGPMVSRYAPGYVSIILLILSVFWILAMSRAMPAGYPCGLVARGHPTILRSRVGLTITAPSTEPWVVSLPLM